jgi:hypothetical protein
MFPGGGECDGAGRMVTWKHATQPYVKNTDVYKCLSNPRNTQPDETRGGDKFGYTVFPISYAYNGTILWSSPGPNQPVISAASVPETARYIMLVEANQGCGYGHLGAQVQ